MQYPDRGRTLPQGQSFRLKQKYWGRIRSASEEPTAQEKLNPDDLCISRALREVREGGKKMSAKASSKLAQWTERSENAVVNLKMRSFSQPNEETLATFEKA